MSTLTPEDRDRLRELASGATPGPWMFDRDQRDGWMVVFGGNEHHHGYNIIGSNEYLEPADAEFIAAARTAVPALLDMLDQAEQRIRDLTQEARDERAACLDQIEQVQARDARIKAEQDHARAQVDRVRELHPDMSGECHTCSNENGPLSWPCPTIRALDGEQ